MRANKYIEVLSVFEPLGSKWRQMGYSLFIQNVLANVHLSNLKQFTHIFFFTSDIHKSVYETSCDSQFYSGE